MEQFFLDLVKNDSHFSWLIQFLLMAVVSIIPFAPIPVLAAYIASHHDFITGLFINLFGTLTGSILLFLLSKTLLRQFSLRYLEKKQSLSKYLLLIESNGFLAVLLGRLIPILPSAGINLLAGISNVGFVAFTFATLLGKLPTIIAFSLAGHQMAAGNWHIVFIIGLYLLVLVLIGRKIKQSWSK